MLLAVYPNNCVLRRALVASPPWHVAASVDGGMVKVGCCSTSTALRRVRARSVLRLLVEAYADAIGCRVFAMKGFELHGGVVA
jgi:hypothetical protein